MKAYAPAALPAEKNLVYTNWGRSAVEAALRIDGLEGGSVLLPAFICQESFEGVFERLAIEPIFVDIDPITFHLDLEDAEAKASMAGWERSSS